MPFKFSCYILRITWLYKSAYRSTKHVLWPKNFDNLKILHIINSNQNRHQRGLYPYLIREVFMTLLKSIRFIALVLIIALSNAMHTSQPAHSTSKCYQDKPISLAERIRVTKLLNDHADEVKHVFRSKEFSWLPGYYIKTDKTRIKGAQALNNCIKKFGLKFVVVPEKWVYKIPKPEYLGNQHLVIAKKLTETSGPKEMSLEQAKEVFCLLRNAQYEGLYYADTDIENLLFCADGRIGFIDTETRGFLQYPWDGLKELMTYRRKSPEAEAFLQQKLAQVSR